MSDSDQVNRWGVANVPDWLGVFEADTLPKRLPRNCSLVVSYGKESSAAMHGGSVLHWCGFIKRGSFGLWLDPMGRAPDADSFDLHIKRPGFTSYIRQQCPAGFNWQHKRVENWGGVTCGQWSLAMCRAGGGPNEKPDRFRWLTKSIRENQRLVKQLVKLE